MDLFLRLCVLANAVRFSAEVFVLGDFGGDSNGRPFFGELEMKQDISCPRSLLPKLCEELHDVDFDSPQHSFDLLFVLF